MKKKKNIRPIKNAEKETPTKKADEWRISIKLGSMAICGAGKTALEALRNVPQPLKITTKGIITISHGAKKKELVYTVPKLRRLFYPIAQPIIIKYLAGFLK